MFEAIFRLLDSNSHVVLILLILLVIYLTKSQFVIISHWHHTFDGVQFSTMEFYSAVDEAMKSRDIPGVSTGRVTHNSRIFFSGKREYLRIKRNGMAFDVCAAPNGTGLYVSWWHHENYSNFDRLILMKIPIINWMFRSQTLHQFDLELMFEDIVQTCVLEACDAMTGTQGSTLSETERAIIHNWGAIGMK